MKCVNCEKEFDAGLEQCPHCGCHYPESGKKNIQPQKVESEKKPIDTSATEKQVNELIEAIIIKGSITEKERRVILRKAQEGGLDPDVIEIKLDAAIAKIQKSKIKEDKNGTVEPESQEIKGQKNLKPKVVELPTEPKVSSESVVKEQISTVISVTADSTNNKKSVESSMTGSDTSSSKDREKKEETNKVSPIVFKYCKKCGAQLPLGAVFCKKCGNKL